MVQYRDYQVQLQNAAREKFLRGFRSVLMVAPTGSGKTAMFTGMAHRAAQKQKRVGILAHRQELIDQISAALHQLETPHGLIVSGETMVQTHNVWVGSVQTVVRRLHKITPPDLLVIDEAHHAVAGSYRKILDCWTEAFRLGVTATPERLDGRGLGSMFQQLVSGPTVKTLQDAGWLARVRYYGPPKALDFSGVNIRGGDYAKEQLASMFDKPKIIGDAVEHYARICPGRPAVVFCVSIHHAESVAEAFRAAGFRAATIDGALGAADRRERVACLGDGRLNVLTSCDIVSEGFDLPVIEAAIQLRPTASLALHRQQLGRALRPSPGKQFAIIIDHVGNLARHGLAEDEPQWTLDGNSERKRKAAEEQMPVVRSRQCPACYCVHPPEPKCPQCGHEYVGREIEQVAGQLVELNAPAAVRSQDGAFIQCPQCLGVQAADLNTCPKCGHSHKWHRRSETAQANTLQALIELGRKRGYKNPLMWAQHVFVARHSKRTAPDTPPNVATTPPHAPAHAPSEHAAEHEEILF